MRQLVLDPAISKEYQRLRVELEERGRQVQQLQEELEAVQFTQVRAVQQLLILCDILTEEQGLS